MKPKQKPAYSRSIKLSPAVGDWTKIQFPESDLDEIYISSVLSSNFNSLPKEKLKYVHYLHYRLAEKVAKQFSQDMDIKVELHTINATQITYEEFIKSQLDQVIQTNLFVEGFGKVSVIFDWGLADSIVNRLTGGKGEEAEVTSFSDIEQSILQSQVECILPSFSEAWKSVFTQDQVSLELICGDYVQDKKYSLREAYVVFSYSLYFGKGELKKMIWAYPSEVLRKLLTAKQALEDPIKKRVALQNQTMRSTKVEVKGILGKASLTMKELKHLQPGDIIPLDTSLQSPLDLIVGGRAKFSAQAGVLNHRLCMQLIFFDENDALESVKKSERDLPHSPKNEFFPQSVQSAVRQQEPMQTWVHPEVAVPAVEEDAWDDLPEEFQPVTPTPISQQPSFFEEKKDEAQDEEEPFPVETEEEDHEEEFEFEEEDALHEDLHEEDDHEEKPLTHFEEDPPQDSDTTQAQPQAEEDEFSWDDLDTNF